MGFGSLINKMKGIVSLVQNFSRTQIIIASVATVTAVGGVGTGGYLIYDHFSQPTEIMAEIIISTEKVETEEPEVEVVAEEVLVTEETEAAEPETVTLVGSSIEKDLKIKIQDVDSKNIKGQNFEISVQPDTKNAKASVYNDHDQDGIIYIKTIDAGDYKVTLNEIEGFIPKEDTINVTVKDKIEYTKVDVADEIKDASEVAASEDAQVDNVEVESVLADTVALLDSTVTPQTVSGADVDISKFPKATTGGTSTFAFDQTGSASNKRGSYRTTSETGSTESTEPKPVTEYDYTIEHYFDGVIDASKTQTGKGALNATITATDYTADYTTTSSTTLTISDVVANNTLKVEWVKKEVTTPPSTELPETTKYEYKIEHYFDGVLDETKTQSGTDVKDAVITATDYSTDYTTTSKLTLTVAAEGTNALKVEWIKKVTVTGASMSGAIPQTASLYNSSINNANTTKLTMSLTDANNIVQKVEWKSENSKIVQVAAGDKTGTTITAAAKGSAKVTATITYLSKPGDTKTTATTTVSCTVTVNDYASNTSTPLVDKKGRSLYKDSACKTIATIADYKANGTYYTSPVYTGWQTLDGKVYYFNANNQPITGSQVISGISYTFGSDGALQQGSGKNGIDVSSHQGNIDWSAVKAAGISFAIIRVGYRGSQQGSLVEDAYFKKNIQGATSNGISVGVYFFTQAISEAEAVEEASMALTLCSGYNLAYPIFVDTENGSSGARANGLDKATRTACVSAFCKTIANGGRKPGVYASKSWYNSKIDASAFSNYFIWVAQYNTSCTYTGKYNMWQYSSKGSVPGIKGNVDVNIAY